MEMILSTRNLAKKFGNKEAVKDATMTIEKGEIYGLLGPNGSGKTTTLRMILGLITPTKGEIELFGKVMDKGMRPPFERIGSMIEPGLYGNLTVIENLKVHAKLMGYQSLTRIEEVLHLLDLYDARNTRGKNLSLGMKQRVCIARAILHKPELLILDEPINAIDPKGTKKIREIFVDMARKYDTTILMSTHLLSEIELVATKIGFFYQGVLIKELDHEGLKNKNRHYLEIKVKPVQKAIYLLEHNLNILDYEVVDKDVIRLYEKVDESSAINRLLIQGEVEVIESKQSKDKLESYFLELIGDEDRV
jgi:bacitracin transport system ATP-binding protein